MRTVALGLLLFGVGVAVGYVLAGGRTADRKLAELVAASEDAPKQVSLGDWIAAQPEPETPRGDHTVHGTVKFEDGRPAPGVAMWVQYDVEWDFWRIMVDARPNDPSDAERTMKALLHKYRFGSTYVAETTTDAGGAFKMGGISLDMGYGVRGHLEGYEVRELEPSATPHAAKKFVAHKLHRVDVDLRLPGGLDPSRADLVLSANGWTSSIVWRPGEETLWLPVGAYRLSADVWRNDVHLYDSRKVTFTIREDTAAKTIGLNLKAVAD